MAEPSLPARVAYSPGEFAALFGKSQTWGYRQIYSGKVTAITQHGRILIPAKEVERILESAGIYDGSDKPKQAKTRIAGLTPEQKSIWQRFVEMRRGLPGQEVGAPDSSHREETELHRISRRSIFRRIANAWEEDEGR